jgi:hypothetical protein
LPTSVWINQPAPGSALNEPTFSTILTTAGTEDRATLESDLSADIGERCSAGQGPLLCPDSILEQLHCSTKR